LGLEGKEERIHMAEEITAKTVRHLLPARPWDGHKGTFGHVFILGGSRGFTGATKLAAIAAGRSGAGLVTVGIPSSLADIIATSTTECMTLPLPATATESLAGAALEPALEFAATKQAIALGPGISQNPGTHEFVVEFVRRCPAPTVIDADGLNCLGEDPEVLLEAAGPRILTPHPGEMARLTEQPISTIQEEREAAAVQFAERYRCVVVLKGQGTVVADGQAAPHINTTGNSGMATGGTGDILTGLIGGLLAQGMTGMNAALLGVYLHGLAGDIAAERKTARALIASDVNDALPEAWRTIEQDA
jgi:ADP-dependent NAD(P)H-hydrate dehydratase / NAD(P)H-hydrate epimerase